MARNRAKRRAVLPPAPPAPAAVNVLGVRVDATSYGAATRQILHWARQHVSKYVCCANVHVVMEAHDAPDFADILRDAGLVTPDGMPLVWYLRALGLPQERVYGPDLMLHVCQAAADAGIPIGLFGGSEATLQQLGENLRARFAGLDIAYAYAPPFRPLGVVEDAQLVRELSRSRARILFVGLGCPKQERWMAEHADKLQLVMLGVGAAFDFHAGTVAQAPRWMQARGLEWLYRLSREPKRLFMRYARHNPRFALYAAAALMRRRLTGHQTHAQSSAPR